MKIRQWIKHLRFVRSFPLAMRATDGAIRSRLGRHRLRNVQLAVTYGCNFKCEFCSAAALEKKRKPLTLNEWKEIWDEIYKLGVIHADITGGEPMLMGADWLCELISYINKNNDIIVSLATNGWYLDELKLKKLKEAGLNTVEISMHSTWPSVHDEITKVKESWYRAFKTAIIASQRVGLNVCISAVLTSGNFEEIEDLAKTCGLFDLILIIQLVAAVGRWVDKEEMELSNLWSRYQELLSRYPCMRDDTAFNFRGGETCPGGIEKWYVTAYGDVMQCSFVPVSYGNLLEEAAERIYERICSFPMLTRRSRCKRTWDKEFIEKLLQPTKRLKELPVSYRRVVK